MAFVYIYTHYKKKKKKYNDEKYKNIKLLSFLKNE